MKLFALARDIILHSLFPDRNIVVRCNKVHEKDLSLKLRIRTFTLPTKTTAFFSYRDETVRDLIKALKYEHYSRAAELFGTYMSDYLLEELADEALLGSFHRPILIPIPISQKKKDERGYNQSELLVKQIVAQNRGKLPVTQAFDVLRRIGNPASQTQTGNKEERRENVKGSFVVLRKIKIANMNIMLVDDVATTGATLAEAERVLKKAGAKSVRAIVVAH